MGCSCRNHEDGGRDALSTLPESRGFKPIAVTGTLQALAAQVFQRTFAVFRIVRLKVTRGVGGDDLPLLSW